MKRKQYFKKILALTLSLFMLAGLAACGGSGSGATDAQAQDTTAAQTAETSAAAPGGDSGAAKTGLGPNMLLLPTMENMSDKFPEVWANYGLIGRMMLYSRLLRLDAQLKPVYGDLAETWTASDDGLNYSFTLREGVKWHDGTDLTADDVAFSIKFALKAVPVNPVIKGALMNIKGAKAYVDDEAAQPAGELEGIQVQDNVLSIEMEKPSGTFLLAMAQFNILPRHKIEGMDPLNFGTSDFFANPIGSGPYYVKEFKPNDYALLEVFPDYFGNKPQIQQVKLTQMTQADYATRALANEIDFFHINDLATAEAAAANPNYEMFFTDIYFVRYFMWNSHGSREENAGLFDDLRTRRAFVHAIDRASLIEALMPGQAQMTDTKVPAAFPYYNSDVYNLEFSPEKAKQLLTDANFDFTKTVRLAAYYSDQGTANFMDAICAYLADIGVKAEWKLLTGDITAQLYDTKDYDFVYAGLSAMTVEEAYNLYHSETLKNLPFGKLFPENQTNMDALLEELWVTTDEARRNTILNDMQKVEAEEMFWFLPMFSLRNIQVFNTARVNLPEELILSNEWSNYERYLDKWTLNSAE